MLGREYVCEWANVLFEYWALYHTVVCLPIFLLLCVCVFFHFSFFLRCSVSTQRWTHILFCSFLVCAIFSISILWIPIWPIRRSFFVAFHSSGCPKTSLSFAFDSYWGPENTQSTYIYSICMHHKSTVPSVRKYHFYSRERARSCVCVCISVWMYSMVVLLIVYKNKENTLKKKHSRISSSNPWTKQIHISTITQYTCTYMPHMICYSCMRVLYALCTAVHCCSHHRRRTFCCCCCFSSFRRPYGTLPECKRIELATYIIIIQILA